MFEDVWTADCVLSVGARGFSAFEGVLGADCVLSAGARGCFAFDCPSLRRMVSKLTPCCAVEAAVEENGASTE